MVLSSGSKFQSLSIRPPTPPKDLDDEVLDFIQDPFGTKEPVVKLAPAKSVLNTPEQSPSSDSIPSTANSRKKRVNFQPQPCTIRADGFSLQPHEPLHSSPLRPLPQTRVSRPLKSILKPSDVASTPPPAEHGTKAWTHKSFAEMLESIVKQLASGSRPTCIDAYHSLHKTMHAYDNIPDIQALVSKMGLLTQFIRRDLQATGIHGNGLDSQLIGQALMLLMALVRLPELRAAMDDDFCNFVLDRSIQVIADKDMHKSVVNKHMALLMQQTFAPRIMTQARVEKILDAVNTIHDRVTGQSVLAYRIRVFRKLVQQRPEVMARNVEKWYRHMVQSLVNTQKDISQSALDMALSAAKALGTERHARQEILEILNRVRPNGDSFAKVLADQLRKLLETEYAVQVPQIWAVVTALLPGSLQKGLFPALEAWLKVWEQCCKSTKESVRMHANVALCFLTYAVYSKGPEELLNGWPKILLGFPQHQFQLHPLLKMQQEPAASAYYTLLYYCFQPQATHAQLDRFWTEYMVNFYTPLIEAASPGNALAACRTLTALFDGTRRNWDAQRALELRLSSLIKREELPVLDPKWVRKSMSTILKFVETLLNAVPWTTEEGRDDPIKTMWLSLLQSLKAAGSQEVMASSESKDAMAELVNLLRRVWESHTAQLALSQQMEDIWAEKFCFLLETVVDRLGAQQFSEKFLTWNGQDMLEAASTPSHRSRQSGIRTSPLLSLVDLLVNQSEGKLSDHVRLRGLSLTIEPCFEAQKTRFSRLELLRDCSTTARTSASIVSDSFWMQIAGLAKTCIEEKQSGPNAVSRSLGQEYDLVVEIMRLGSATLAGKPLGYDLLASLSETVLEEAGEGAYVLAVVEKVSEVIFKQVDPREQSTHLPWLSLVLRSLPTVVARKTIELGRQRLWPSSNVARTPDFDPYNHLYDAILSISSAAYRDLSAPVFDVTREFLLAFAHALKGCHTGRLAVFLRKVQNAICVWVEDPERKLEKRDQRSKDLHKQVMSLWKEVCAAIEKLPRKDSQILLHLEPLLAAGFVSRRRGIITMSVATWNATFGREETLRYPSQLEQALCRLRNSVNLLLPSLHDQGDLEEHEPWYFDSDSDEQPKPRKSPRVKESPFRIRKASRPSRSPAVQGPKRTPGRQTRGVRLRHEDSQIHFEDIISSPSDPYQQESQILTERQKEMIERQRGSRNPFAEPGPIAAPTMDIATRPQSEPKSNALDADDLPINATRTPLRSLTSLGPMDVFVGSSPTPQARNRTQEVVSDQISVSTPTAVRIAHLDNDGELGSSPPQFEKNFKTIASALRSSDGAEGFSSVSGSFDEGTTLDDAALYEAERAETAAHEEVEDTFDMQSSTIDLQLTAQIDADMQAQEETVPSKQPEETSDEPDVYMAAASSTEEFHAEPSSQAEAQVQETQLDLSSQFETSTNDAETSSISRIGDSFSSRIVGTGSPRIGPLSSRHPSNTPRSTGAIKPNSHGRRSGKRKDEAAEPEVHPPSALAHTMASTDGMHDNIVVASPKTNATSKKGRRSSPAVVQVDAVVPEINRKRSIRRSASLLSQVELRSDVGEDTPATKRARKRANQDVSQAKETPRSSQGYKVSRLSHVQITPKRSSDAGSSSRASSVAIEAKQATGAPVAEKLAVADSAQQHPTVSGGAGESGKAQRQAPSQTSVSTPGRSFAERVILTPRSIINQLKSLRDALIRSSQMVLGRQEEREIDDALFELRREVHDAGRRGEGRRP